MKREVIMIEGMTCIHCEKAVKNAVLGTSGVTDCLVDLKTKSVEVEYNPEKTTLLNIHKSIEEEGYQVIQENKRKCWSC